MSFRMERRAPLQVESDTLSPTHAEGVPRLRRALDLAVAEEWDAAAVELAAAHSSAPGLPVFPSLAAAISLQAGRRREAIALLAGEQSRDPADPQIAHRLLLACYHTLRDAQATSCFSGGEVSSLAERAIASWVVLSHQDRFWTRWLRSRLKQYGEDRPGPLRRELRAELEARIRDLTTTDSRKLSALFQRETAAAGQLAALGGFPWTVSSLICGPLMIQALGCAEAFGAFVTGWRLAPGEPERLRRTFSRLGLVQALLDLDRPEEAWAALGELSCRECRAAAAAQEAVWSPVVCKESCPRFDYDNPGYAGVPDKAYHLERDALELAVGVQVARGYAELISPESDPEVVAGHFREALRLAALLGEREAAERSVVEAVLGRVKALTEKRDWSPAIALLEAGRTACDVPGATAPAVTPREELTGRLAEILTRRGGEAVQEGRWEAASTDLQRAVALNPYASNSLLTLSFALQSWARRLRHTDPARAVELVLDAVRQLQGGWPGLRDQPGVQKRFDQARKAARDFLQGRAAGLAASGGFEQALQVLERGLALLPDDPSLAKGHRDMVQRYARFLGDQGQSERATTVLQRGTRRHSGPEDTRPQ